MNPEILWIFLQVLCLAFAIRLGLAILAEVIDEVRHEVRRNKRRARR